MQGSDARLMTLLRMQGSDAGLITLLRMQVSDAGLITPLRICSVSFKKVPVTSIGICYSEYKTNNSSVDSESIRHINMFC